MIDQQMTIDRSRAGETEGWTQMEGMAALAGESEMRDAFWHMYVLARALKDRDG